MERTPVSELPPLHQDLIHSWKTKTFLSSMERKGSPRQERDRNEMERAIADLLSTQPATFGQIIVKFGGNGKVDKVLQAIESLRKSGAIEAVGPHWYRKVG